MATEHESGCPCVVCNPVRCTACGIASPTGRGISPRTGRCSHRRACEARQMLSRGESVSVAAAHAQRLSSEEETG